LGGKRVSEGRTPLAPGRAPLASEDSVKSDLIYDVGELKRQALRAYRRIFIENRVFGNDGLLSKVNWKRPLIWRLEALLPKRPWHDTHAKR
jgi:hypothetical protein